MDNKEPRQAVIYSRIASADPVADREATRPGQERRCREYADANGYAVAATFRDIGSGSKCERSGMTAMLAFLREHRAENIHVLIAEPQRLARNAGVFIELCEKIRDAGGSLESVEPSRREIGGRRGVRLVEERERER